MIELVNEAVDKAEGAVVCLEYGNKLTYDIHHGARLIDTEPYEVKSYQLLRGFITGLCAGNYDINDIFIDSLTKISGNSDLAEAERFLSWCSRFGETHGVRFTVSISALLEQTSGEFKKAHKLL